MLEQFHQWLEKSNVPPKTALGANVNAMLYSIIETAKANGLTPFDYVVYCLEQLSDQNADIETLLP